MYQYWLTKYNKCTRLMLMEDVNNGVGGMAEGVYDNSLYSLLSFSVNSKLFLKNLLIN